MVSLVRRVGEYHDLDKRVEADYFVRLADADPLVRRFCRLAFDTPWGLKESE